MEEECAGYWEGLTGWIPLLFDRWTEVINIMLSIILIMFVTVNPTLRSTYKVQGSFFFKVFDAFI